MDYSRAIKGGLALGAIMTMAPYHCDGPEGEPRESATLSAEPADTYRPLPGDGLWDAAEACTDSATALQLVFDGLVARYGEQYVLRPGEPIEVPAAEGVDPVCPTNDLSHLP